jgi:beta-galactosidase
MSMNMMESDSALSIQWAPDSIRIHGKPEIILCASLFYFRIPRAEWRSRMEQAKAFGYNAIDVYFPWNYHEKREGEWDFSGERDVDAFLKTAAEVGLWIIARPGPYICSEWDGGALPAYLFAKDDITLRDNDPVFLHEVSRWFDRILPLLQRYELGRGGTVIAVQLDNELDFYDCRDPHGYIAALRDMALNNGIQVPLIACAGQGGLYEASGFAEGVVPTCNFYPSDRDPEFEQKVTAYKNELADRGLPLLVTETNRSHFLLRRLLSCGTKLLGPYLQVSGTNFGFTNATNNWGKPLAFMTSDYDFYGMVSPEGRIRDEAYEGRMLHRLIQTYGSSLAEAKPALNLGTTVVGTKNTTVRQSLELKLGGNLLFVTNVGGEAEEITLRPGSGQKDIKRACPAGECAILPIDVPLGTWGLSGTLLYSTAELTDVKQTSSRTVMVFHTEREGEIVIRLDERYTAETDTSDMKLSEEGDVLTISFTADYFSTCRVQLNGGHLLELVGMKRTDALLLEEINESGNIVIGSKITYDLEPRTVENAWSTSRIEPSASMVGAPPVALNKADFLEKQGFYRGYAWYEASYKNPADESLQGVLIRQGSDVVSVYNGLQYIDTVTPGGGSRYIPISAGSNANDAGIFESAGQEGGHCSSASRTGRLNARVEIWGHTNFDDARLPGLRLNACKGLTGMTAVTDVKNVTSNWRVLRTDTRELQADLVNPGLDDRHWPLVSFGGWLSPDHPAFEYYRRSFRAGEDADSWTLHFQGLQAMARVFVNDMEIANANPFDPYLDISAFVTPGEVVHISVFLERVLGLPAGNVLVYEGSAAAQWKLSAAEEPELLLHAAGGRNESVATEMPLMLEPGEMCWLYGTLQDSNDGAGWRVFVQGSNLKLTVFFNGQMVGRLWTPGGEARPVMTGGDPDSFYLPGAWFREEEGKEGNELTIMLEAVVAGKTSVLEGFAFIPTVTQILKEKGGIAG